MASTKRGGPLPDVATVRRKIGAGLDPASPDITTGDWLTSWLAGKGKLKASVRRSYAQHITLYLVPLIGEIPLARLRAEHIASVFATIREWNAEIERQRGHGRAWIYVTATWHGFPGGRRRHRAPDLCDAAGRAQRRRQGAADPVESVRRGGTAARAARGGPRVGTARRRRLFLDATAGHRLHPAWRLVLLRGLRRGEVCGLQLG